MNRLILFFCGICIALPFTTLNAQDATKFDKNGSGKLEPIERQAYFLHRNSEAYRKFDTDFDGILSPSEIKKLQETEVQEASLDEEDRLHVHPSEESPTIAEMSTMFLGNSPKSETVPLFGFQIRRSLADVEPGGSYNAKTPPATFSYQRDFAGDGDAWTAKGVVARPFLFEGVGSSSLIPSFEFDRFSHQGDPAEERDLLIFRLGSDIGLPGIPDGKTIAGNRLRVNGAFKTDSGFREKTWAGEVEWETSLGPLGGFHPLGTLPIAWYPRAYPRAEFGTRSDNRELLTEDQKDFFRLGPVVALQLTPYFQKGWDDRFILTFEYAYLLSAKGDRSVRNLAARFDWNLDKDGHLKLGVEYQKGAPTLEEGSTKTLKVGLGVAF